MQYPAIDKARRLVQHKFPQHHEGQQQQQQQQHDGAAPNSRRVATAGATRSRTSADSSLERAELRQPRNPWREDLEAAYMAASSSLSSLADWIDEECASERRRAEQLYQDGLRANSALNSLDWSSKMDLEEAVCARSGDGHTTKASPLDELQEQGGVDQGPSRDSEPGVNGHGGCVVASRPSEPESKVVGIRSIRGLSLRVRESKGMDQKDGASVRLEAWLRTHIIHSRAEGEEENRGLESIEREMQRVVYYSSQLQRRVLHAMLGRVRYKRELRRRVAKRCLVGGSRFLHRSFQGLDAERIRCSEGTTGLANEHFRWRAKGVALVRLMRSLAQPALDDIGCRGAASE